MPMRKKSERLKKQSQYEQLEPIVAPMTSRPKRGWPGTRPTVTPIMDTPTVGAPLPEAGHPQTTAEMEQLISYHLTVSMENSMSVNERMPI